MSRSVDLATGEVRLSFRTWSPLREERAPEVRGDRADPEER